MRPGHLSVGVGEGSRRSEEIVKKNLELRLSVRLLLLLYYYELHPPRPLIPAAGGGKAWPEFMVGPDGRGGITVHVRGKDPLINNTHRFLSLPCCVV